MSEGEVIKTRTLEEVKKLVLTLRSGFDSEHLLWKNLFIPRIGFKIFLEESF